MITPPVPNYVKDGRPYAGASLQNCGISFIMQAERRTIPHQRRSHTVKRDVAYYHLPCLFEFYELYQVFLALFTALPRIVSGAADGWAAGNTTPGRCWS